MKGSGEIMRDKANNPDGGFTLVEIIASIVLLGLVISVFMAIFPQMINWSNSAEKELVSSNLTAKVANDIYEGDYQQDLNAIYSNLTKELNGSKECKLGSGEYKPIQTSDGLQTKDFTENVNNIVYTIQMEACVKYDEYKDSLMRVHFTITNTETKHKIDSLAFYKGAEVVGQ